AGLVGQVFGGAGFGAGVGVSCDGITPTTSMLSSHQPSSCGVSLHPGPYSKYEEVTLSNCQVVAIQRIRILWPSKLSRLNFDCTQTPFPAGSTTPPLQWKVCTGPPQAAQPQCVQAFSLKHIVSCTPRGAGGAVPVSVGVNSQYWAP